MNFVTVIMLAFSVLGGLDRILGNRLGLGKEFEKGFNLLGVMALSMIGMIVLSPLIAQLMEPCFSWIYRTLHMDPSVIPASFFANDMGGASLSAEITKDPAIGLFNGLVVSTMMGCTLSFTVPYSLSCVKQEHHKALFTGILCGLVTIPVGCFIAGLVQRLPLGALLVNLLPLVILSALIAAGLILFPEATVKAFSWLGIGIKFVIGIGLMLGIFQFLTGISLVEGLADLKEGADVCINAAIVLSGAFPLMYLVSKILSCPLAKLGKLLGIGEIGAMGLLASLVTNATTMEMMNTMDKKGIIVNGAFAVSASFVFGSHLAFTMAFDKAYLVSMIVGKLVAGICAVLLSLAICKRVIKEETQVA